MESYCVRFKKYSKNVNPIVSNTSNCKKMILSKCAECTSKKFIKNQEEKGLLSSLGLRTPLSKVPVLDNILFWMEFHWVQLRRLYEKMNETVNEIVTFLSARDNQDLLIVAFEPFTKNKERIQKFKETRDTKYIYRNELDEACFQHDMTYGDFEDFAKRTDSDKVLKDEAFNIAKNPKYDGYQRGLLSMVYKIFG